MPPAAAERKRKAPPQGKYVKIHPFWMPPELVERLKSTQLAATHRVQIRISRSELLRTVILLGLDEYDRRMVEDR